MTRTGKALLPSAVALSVTQAGLVAAAASAATTARPYQLAPGVSQLCLALSVTF